MIVSGEVHAQVFYALVSRFLASGHSHVRL
jgi:hypothetical protein